jgi:hypothetical protein
MQSSVVQCHENIVVFRWHFCLASNLGSQMNMDPEVLALLVVSVSTLLFAGTPQSKKENIDVTTVRVRYMVQELDPAVEFYTKYLAFQVKQERRPNFAFLLRGSLELG